MKVAVARLSPTRRSHASFVTFTALMGAISASCETPRKVLASSRSTNSTFSPSGPTGSWPNTPIQPKILAMPTMPPHTERPALCNQALGRIYPKRRCPQIFFFLMSLHT